MCEIKFKVWMPYTKTMMVPKTISQIHESRISGMTVGQFNQWVYLQFIGERDGNKKEMYVGDIFKWGNLIGEMIFTRGCFVFKVPGMSMTLHDHVPEEFE